MILNIIKEKIANSPLSVMDKVLYLYYKGFFQAIRGMLLKLVIHKSKGMIFVGRNVKILHAYKLSVGANCFFSDNSYINCLCLDGVYLGDRVTIREFAWLQLTSHLNNPGSKIVIGDNTYIGPRANIGAAGDLIIGKNCMFGAGVSFVAENHNFLNKEISIIEQGVSRKGIEIGDDCWFGNNVTILDGVTVGQGSVVGAGAVVTKSFSEYSVLAGVPAKMISKRK